MSDNADILQARRVCKADLDHLLWWLAGSAHSRWMFRTVFGPRWRQMLRGPRLMGLVRLPHPELFDGWGLVIADRRGRLWAYITADLDGWRVRTAEGGIRSILRRTEEAI